MAITSQSDSPQGKICPRCQGEPSSLAGSEAPARPSLADGVPKCPVDGYAYVTRAAYELANGDPFLGATVSDRYVVLGRLGAGSMGTVYRACHVAMGRDVALKILRSDRAFDAQAKARFAREARAMSMLHSLHTATVYDFGEAEVPRVGRTSGDTELSLFLALELLDGESLGQRLKRRGRLSVREAARICTDAAKSLAEAHDKGIIHRDLKPDNLFLIAQETSEVSCKLLDFGIAKVLEDPSRAVDALETQAGTVFGTPRYMSPEQAQGKPLDARSDLYSLGVLLYHMLVGRAPFADDDAVVVMAHHIKSTPIPPVFAAPDAAIPPALNDFVLRCLAKDPAKRPPTAAAFLRGVEGYLVETPTADGLTVGPRSHLPRRGIAAVVSAAVVVAGAAAWWVGGHRGAAGEPVLVAQRGIAAALSGRVAAPLGIEPGVAQVAPPPATPEVASAAPSSESSSSSPKAAPGGAKPPPRPKYVLFD